MHEISKLLLHLKTLSKDLLRPKYPTLNRRRLPLTPCAPPKMDSVVKDIENIIVGVIELIIIDNINKALKGATVTVQHTHSYCFERDQKDVADTRLMKWYLIFGLTRSLVLASIIGIIVLTYFNSKAYLGKQYKEIYSSPYLSGTKREILSGLPHHNYSPNQV